MNKLNNILHELGISKVKLAKYLGVSRQMIYNYLELGNIDKWPKDKKVLLLNLLGIKNAEEMENIKVDTDYIMSVEARLNSVFEKTNGKTGGDSVYNGLGKKQRDLMQNLVEDIKERLEDQNDAEAFATIQYLQYFLQTMETSEELKYILGYVAKAAGFVKPLVFDFNEDEQFIFESILFSAMSLYKGGGASKNKLAESHRRFVAGIEQKAEEKLSRTMEINAKKVQALKELGYTKITEENAAEVLAKIVEIDARKVIE